MASTNPPERVTVDRADLFLLSTWADDLKLLPEEERPSPEQQRLIDDALRRIRGALSQRP
jgi:hypothetical protein